MHTTHEIGVVNEFSDAGFDGVDQLYEMFVTGNCCLLHQHGSGG